MYTETSSCTPANGCPQNQGSLPGGCGALAFPFVAMQQQDPPRYDQREALQQGTLFPGLDLPFHKELRSRFPAANNALSELMALDFAIDELGLYLVTHADDQEGITQDFYSLCIRIIQRSSRIDSDTFLNQQTILIITQRLS